jgi:hypothetical protein
MRWGDIHGVQLHRKLEKLSFKCPMARRHTSADRDSRLELLCEVDARALGQRALVRRPGCQRAHLAQAHQGPHADGGGKILCVEMLESGKALRAA